MVIAAIAIQIPAYLSLTTPTPLSLDTNAPLSHEFRRPAFNPHLESLHHQFRWLLGTFYRVCFLQARSNFLKRGGFLLRRGGFSQRFRKTLAGDGKRFFEVIGIEPALGPQAFQQPVFPYPGGLDIEFALLLLIDRLHSETGDGPLSAHPKDIAMQGHFAGSLRKKSFCRRC